MKHKSKSAPIKALVLVTCLAGLAACGDIEWPHAFGGNEVPKSVLDAPRPIEMPPPKPSDTGWLRLGDVPSRPKDFTPPAASDAVKQHMEQQRGQARILREQLEPPGAETPLQPSASSP